MHYYTTKILDYNAFTINISLLQRDCLIFFPGYTCLEYEYDEYQSYDLYMNNESLKHAIYIT